MTQFGRALHTLNIDIICAVRRGMTGPNADAIGMRPTKAERVLHGLTTGGRRIRTIGPSCNKRVVLVETRGLLKGADDRDPSKLQPFSRGTGSPNPSPSSGTGPAAFGVAQGQSPPASAILPCPPVEMVSSALKACREMHPSGHQQTDTTSQPHAACRRSLDNAWHRAQPSDNQQLNYSCRGPSVVALNTRTGRSC
jgi:hypothetical protein